MARSTRNLLPSTLITEASVSAGQPSRRAAWAAVVPVSSSNCLATKAGQVHASELLDGGRQDAGNSLGINSCQRPDRR